MADLTPNKRPDGQSPEDGGLEKSLESLSLDELLASVKDDLARVDAMMNDKDEAEQAKTQAEAELEQETQPQKQTPNMPPLFEPKIPEEYADLTVDQETQPESQEPEKKRPRLPSGIRVLLYVCCVLAVAVLLAVAVWRCADDVLSLTKEDAEVTVSIPDGATISQIAGELKSKGLVRYETLFKFYCWASHAEKTIEPGTYTLNSRYDYHALVSNMIEASPDRAVVEVTIPEGYTMEQIFRKLEDENVCSYDDLMDAAANYSYNYSFIDQSMQGDAKRLEGFLFPDTYEFYQGMQASSAINKFLENFHDRITAEMLEKADERGMTMQEVVTVASMIEKEAANDDERAMIAAVIYNRIEAGMPLQIDSTIMYVLPEHKDVLTVEDTKIDSPYNTYQNKGLPPTPIANPGLASIKAALSPASTQALYYALDAESGTHKFFTNYGEFQAFVAKQSYSQ